MRNWIFQANRAYFRIHDALEQTNEITWILTRYISDFSVGDRVAIWISGRAAAGVYAFGSITKIIPAIEYRPDSRFWIEKTDLSFLGKPHAVVSIEKTLIGAPILRSEIRNRKELKRLSIVNAPIGTNFRVSEDEWRGIISLDLSRHDGEPTIGTAD